MNEFPENPLSQDREYVEKKHEQQLNKLGATYEERLTRYTEAYKKLSIPFSDYVYEDEGELSLELKGKENADGSPADVTKMILEYEKGENTRAIFSKDSAYNDAVRKVKRLYLESNNFIFDTDNMPVPKHGIYFKVNKQLGDPNITTPQFVNVGGYNPIADEITVDFPLTTPLGIATVLHEMGHFLRARSSDEQSIRVHSLYSKDLSKLSDTEKALVLHEERAAEAVALKESIEFLKPVVEPGILKNFVQATLLIYSGKMLNGDKLKANEQQ
jgi:hypothetical protein